MQLRVLESLSIKPIKIQGWAIESLKRAQVRVRSPRPKGPRGQAGAFPQKKSRVKWLIEFEKKSQICENIGLHLSISATETIYIVTFMKKCVGNQKCAIVLQWWISKDLHLLQPREWRWFKKNVYRVIINEQKQNHKIY